jgi:hypothetical protein
MTPTETAGTSSHQLRGLEADNLLAFLALLGVLRALDQSRPQWCARVVWSNMPPVVDLTLSGSVDRHSLVLGVEEGTQALATAYAFDRPDITYTQAEFHHLTEQAREDPLRMRVLAALASDGVMKPRKNSVDATPLCAISRGQQHFLARLHAVTSRPLSDDLHELSDALFNEWTYADNSEGFRWDPIEQHRYAYQFGNPSLDKNKIGTVTGANRLAAIGLSVFTTVPTASGLDTLGVTGDKRRPEVCWPIVGVPTSLSGYVALLGHPRLHDSAAAGELRAYGVVGIARSRRIEVEWYLNFERARMQFL